MSANKSAFIQGAAEGTDGVGHVTAAADAVVEGADGVVQSAAAADDLCKKKIHVGAKDYSTLEAMAQCKVPVLFAHGTDDSFVPVEMTYENYKACAAPKRLLIVPGAEHAMSYLLDKEGYETQVKDFWETYDKR